ncbi:ATP-grasp domain-containing protein [Proteobacteria bacterium 005FR1]|nr:ATP-grasp domain-containing protein [Proteobacteria bacterium 005FR1]
MTAKSPLDNTASVDSLFIQAEHLASDFSLFPDHNPLATGKHLAGLVDERKVKSRLKQLQKLDVDSYVAEVVQPAQHTKRPTAKEIIGRLNGKIITSQEKGPFYSVEIELPFSSGKRRIGIIAQERSSANGAWMPEHHQMASETIRRFSDMALPIVYFIDTPGADAGELANSHNQAHSISRMITESTAVDVPTVGIVIGVGYSGGAIPLAAANILLSVRDGIFNTIQPQGLQSIARKFNLSWQECAKEVGVSPEELLSLGCIDGIIDYSPVDTDERQHNLQKAMIASIEAVEKAALEFVPKTPDLFQHYQRNLDRYLHPTEYQQALEKNTPINLVRSPTIQPNIFGLCYRYMRYLRLRGRIHSISSNEYGRLSKLTLPQGDLHARLAHEQAKMFSAWIENPDKLVYDDNLAKAWKNFASKRESLDAERNTVTRFLLGEPKENYEKAKQALLFNLSFSLYNRWKNNAAHNLKELIRLLENVQENPPTDTWPPLNEMTVLDAVMHRELRQDFIEQCKNVLIFDTLYNTVVANLPSIAKEAMETKSLSKESVNKLLDDSLAAALQLDTSEDSAQAAASKQRFETWLEFFAAQRNRGELLVKVEEWKGIGFPQMNDSLFVILTYFFENLLPEYYESGDSGNFKGAINPVRIGRRKDFWNRLVMGYRDLLIQRLLNDVKRNAKLSPDDIINHFFSDFVELDADKASSNPVNFPGFRQAIETAIEKKMRPCGLVTGVAKYKPANGKAKRVGIAVSNVPFQAGAFDMASAEKFCHLLVECTKKQLPVVCFISSGGMQTKEGASALFSMAAVNDRLTRFVVDNDLPVVIFGFGDCTGGAQASFVTHPLVQTYYFSGCNMPFAGQMVVPAYLPSTSTLSNYLSTNPESMAGLVKHPFAPDLDSKLREIDQSMPLPQLTVEEIIENTFSKVLPSLPGDEVELSVDPKSLMKPVKKVLVHARGCTAVKLIRKAHDNNLQVVLVASDPDMTAVPAKMLRSRDRLICLGGNSSDESYLNAHSILQVAEYEQVNALHPGIGFLSETPQFANLCVNHGINFVGPSAYSMMTMGNKSNAIQTVQECDVPVVPGSHGILVSSEQAANIAETIGYPVLLKAVHGGGGKGIQVVRSAADMHKYYNMISTEARSAFGNGDLYLEKFITSMRHIEVQLLRDKYGNSRVLGIRDCSVQRNNQKVVEESGSTMLPQALKDKVMEYTLRIADKVDYMGAGTVEYIYDLEANAVYFMEMNTRLQVEHPVTEATSGIDIVSAQFKIASGESIEDMQPQEKGYAIEVRVTAEKVVVDSNGVMQLAPNPGKIVNCVMPERDDIELISIAATDIEISPFYDSLIAQVICRGESREDVAEKLYDYLDSVVIEGIPTNIALLKRILKDETFRGGEYDTNYLPKFMAKLDATELIREIEEAARSDAAAAMDTDSIRVNDSQELKVFAQSSGIFYTASSPTDPDFVKQGDVVSVNQTLALMEAMKMFSQVSLSQYNRAGAELYPSDKQYRIEHINAANGQQVSSGDLLFIVTMLDE